jgi:hypothetical protein
VTGELYYLGFDPREYAYDLVPRAGGIEVELRVRLTGAYAEDPAHVAAMQAKMDRGARPSMSRGVQTGAGTCSHTRSAT